MEWTDVAIVLSLRRHGETSAIASLLTREHGRQAGLVRGARSRSARAFLQPGSTIRATWRARLAEHLGTIVWEPDARLPADAFDSPGRLSALSSACAIADAALPEREPHADAFAATVALLASLGDDRVWPSAMVKWELGLLRALGYGLNLNSCAATGRTDDLIYVSPRSGRAVSRAAGAPYRDRLLVLPAFLLASGETAATLGAALDGLALTGYFLERNIFATRGRGLPPPRLRLVEILRRSAVSESEAPGRAG